MALGFMRRHRRWLYVFLWVVILGFIVFYIPAFRSADTGSPGEKVGSVSGAAITAGEFQRAYLQRRQLYERLYQGRLDAAALRSLGLEEQVFEGLVAERLIESEARRLGLRVSDEELARSLTSAPDLQENGHFMGADELKRRLRLAGQSVSDFEAGRRARLVAEKLEALVTAGISLAPAEVEREFRRRNEQIKLEYVLVDAARFRSGQQVGEPEIKARFEARRDSYRIPEKRVVSFVLLDPNALKTRVSVTDRDVETYYQERRDEFRQEEEVCASHVLIKVRGADAKEGHGEDEAKQLAQGILDRIRQGGDFPAIAKKESEDKGSAPNGGELGCFGRGRMLPEFENAAFSLGAGETTGSLVRTSAGYHAIRVTARHEESFRPLAQVKEGVRQMLTTQRVSGLADDQAQAITAALAGGRSLADAAKAHGLTVQKSQPLARGESIAPLASPQLVARAFELKAGEVGKERFNLPSGAVAFIALAEVQPSRAPNLQEVRERVKADLLEQRTLEKAQQIAADVRARAEKLGLEKAAASDSLVRKETPALVGRGQPLGDLGSGVALEDAAFALPEKTLSEPLRATSGWAIVRVLEKKGFDAEAFAREKEAVAAALLQAKRGQFFQAFLNELRRGAAVERRPDAFKRLLG